MITWIALLLAVYATTGCFCLLSRIKSLEKNVKYLRKLTEGGK